MRRILLVGCALALAASAYAGTGRFLIANNDAPGVGFNDPTPVAPVGGNPGTTIGQQRLNVFIYAAEQWRRLLNTNVDIIAAASFVIPPPVPCDATSAILGQARPYTFERDFAAAPQSNVWYPVALANKLANADLEPGLPDIFVQFNADVDLPGCLEDSNWYYGLDGNKGKDVDLYVVVLHELGHGLGVSGAGSDPDFLQNRPSVFDLHTFDRTLGLRWDQMSVAQRQVSMTSSGNLVWEGAATTAVSDRFLKPAVHLTIPSPADIAGNYEIGLASFGPDPTTTLISGQAAIVSDEANTDGPSTTDGCTALTNGAALSGKVAVVDRGTCTFANKARNAQAAGALGLIIVNNVDACAPVSPGLSGEDDITIPVISMLRSDGTALKTALMAGESVNLAVDIDPTHRAGATPEGYVRLYAPCTFEPGSSIHHWDDAARPNLLMEPTINDDLLHDVDLALYQLIDMGWTTQQGRRFLKR